MRIAGDMKSLKSYFFIFFCLLFFGLFVRLVHISSWDKNRSTWFYQRNPLLTTMDGYYYLRHTRDFINNTYTPKDKLSPIGIRPYPPSLIVWVTCILKKFLPISLEKIAFYLPCVLCLFMVIPYFLWGREFGGDICFIISAIIGMGSYYWYTRTCLGRFDTDSLIPFFVYTISFFVYRFSVDLKWRNRAISIFWILILSLLFYFWWYPSMGLIPYLLFVPYTISIFDRKLKINKIEYLIKISLFSTGIFFSLFLLFGSTDFLPGFFKNSLTQTDALFNLISKKEVSNLPNISISISELSPPSWSFIFTNISGIWLNFFLSIIGIILLIRFKTRKFIFLSVPAFLSVLTIWGKRFLIYFVPFYAIGMGFFMYFLFDLVQKKISKNRTRVCIAILATIFSVLIGINIYPSLKYTIFPYINSYEIDILKPIMYKKDSNIVWTWWDYGYMVEYFTRKPVMIDGGSQSPLKTYIVSMPLVCKDVNLARNWIKFFATHRESGIYEVGNWLETRDLSKIFDFLKSALSSKSYAKKRYFFLNKKRLSYLFPDKNVYLYLPFQMYYTSHWWHYYGSWDFSVGDGIYPNTYKLPPERVKINLDRGVIQVNERRTHLKKLFVVQNSNLISMEYSGGGLVMFVDGKHQCYVFDENFSGTLFARLVFENPFGYNYFKPLKYDPLWGGLWEVN